jgi:hypothetical protein
MSGYPEKRLFLSAVQSARAPIGIDQRKLLDLPETFDNGAMDRRRRRVISLLNHISKEGICKKDKILANFAIVQGLDQRKVENYCSQLTMAEKLEERIEDGVAMVATPEAWQEMEKLKASTKGISR